jgi:hypothetical protein
MFTLANNWLKPKALPLGGCSSTYTTRADKVKKKDQNNRHKDEKQEVENEEAKKQSRGREQ